MYIKRRQLSKAKIIILGIASFFAVSYLTISSNLGVSPTIGKIYKVEQIVIDAGHGGADPGAIGKNNELEKDINLSIALKLQEIFLLNGMNVVMTRDSDVSIHDPKYTSISKQKTSDIKNRLKISNDNPNSITISIHQNEFSQSQTHGAQMFYGKNNALSEVLAIYLKNSFVQNLQKDNTREIKKSTKSVYLINNAKNPIVLVECGFLSNPQEAALLNTEEYQKDVAFTIYCGVMDFVQQVGVRID